MKIIAKNRKAYHDYEILERVEAGIELVGAEVKSVRQARVALADSYAICRDGEMCIYHLHISPYDRSAAFAPDPYRRRRLLLHRKELRRLGDAVERKNLTLIPLSMYLKNRWVKIELGLCRGRKKYDKREKIKARESGRALSRLVKSR